MAARARCRSTARTATSGRTSMPVPRRPAALRPIIRAGGGCAPTVTIAIDMRCQRQQPHHQRASAQGRLADAGLAALGHGLRHLHGVHRRIASRGCSDYQQNHGYAVWDGAAWKVQYQPQRLPETLHERAGGISVSQRRREVPAVLRRPVDHRRPRGSSNLPFLGPKKLIYADGRATGDRGHCGLRGLGAADLSARCGVPVAERRSARRARRRVYRRLSLPDADGIARSAGDVHHDYRRRDRADRRDRDAARIPNSGSRARLPTHP